MKAAQFAAIAALSLMSGGGPAVAQKAAPAHAKGYLAGAALPDMLRVVPTAPATGSPRDDADRAIFHATRSLQDSPRWKLAQSDDDLSIPGVLTALRCALGVALTSGNAAHTMALLGHVWTDINSATGPAKQHFHRKRPFLVDEGPVCVAEPPNSPDFPSSHSTTGWAVGLIFAEMLPDRSTEIMARGRAYGESRVVCGVHNASAVEAGRVIGAALVEALHGSAQFRTDFEAAKIEIDALRHGATNHPASCAGEAALITTTPY